MNALLVAVSMMAVVSFKDAAKNKSCDSPVLVAPDASLPRSDEFVIAERGKPAACTIVCAKDAAPVVRYAAEELRDYVKKLTGVELDVPPLVTNRAETVKFFSEHVYGKRPDLSGFKKTMKVVETVDVPALNAVRKTVELNTMTPKGEVTFRAFAFFPKQEKKSATFLYLTFRDPRFSLDRTKADVNPQRITGRVRPARRRRSNWRVRRGPTGPARAITSVPASTTLRLKTGRLTWISPRDTA